MSTIKISFFFELWRRRKRQEIPKSNWSWKTESNLFRTFQSMDGHWEVHGNRKSVLSTAEIHLWIRKCGMSSESPWNWKKRCKRGALIHSFIQAIAVPSSHPPSNGRPLQRKRWAHMLTPIQSISHLPPGCRSWRSFGDVRGFIPNLFFIDRFPIPT